MNVPKDIADRLRALDHDPSEYADMVLSQGPDFVRGFVSKIEEADRLFHEWWPKLRDFAEASRRKNPVAAESTLSDRDKAKLSIYETLVTKAERVPLRRTNEALICSMPLLGIPAAVSLWPGTEENSVILTPDEMSEWGDIYEHQPEAFWWFTDYWWRIEDPPKPNTLWTHDTELTTPESTAPWLVVSGLSWGSLAGGETADLWSWDGTHAEFVENVGMCDF